MDRRIKLYLILGLVIGSIVFVLNNQADNSIFYANNTSENELVSLVDISEETILVDLEQFKSRCNEESDYYKITLDNELNIETCQPWQWQEIPRRIQDVFIYME